MGSLPMYEVIAKKIFVKSNSCVCHINTSNGNAVDKYKYQQHQ